MDLNADAPAGTQFSLLSSHQDQVSKLPEGARILAQSEFCPIAGMLVEKHILTFQGHPEFDTAYARALLQIRREAVGEVKYEAAVSSMTQSPDQARVADWILRFIEGDGADLRR
jgi:GMP synthase-like glutamine amidotransferase